MLEVRFARREQSNFGIRGIGLDQVQSLSKYVSLEKQAV